MKIIKPFFENISENLSIPNAYDISMFSGF